MIFQDLPATSPGRSRKLSPQTKLTWEFVGIASRKQEEQKKNIEDFVGVTADSPRPESPHHSLKAETILSPYEEQSGESNPAKEIDLFRSLSSKPEEEPGNSDRRSVDNLAEEVTASGLHIPNDLIGSAQKTLLPPIKYSNLAINHGCDSKDSNKIPEEAEKIRSRKMKEMSEAMLGSTASLQEPKSETDELEPTENEWRETEMAMIESANI
ncbi:hypothetical protein ILUMI_02261, partial [Ignelater luminosus]